MKGICMQVREILSKDEWNETAERFGAHPLQWWQWGELKVKTGPWTARRLVCTTDAGEPVGGAQVLLRSMPFPFRAMAYVPRGPFAAEGQFQAVADAVAGWVKANTKAVSLKVDPAIQDFTFASDWKKSETVLINKTAALSLEPSEDELMAAIPNKKCRQYIRKASRAGINVRKGTRDDLPAVLALYHETAEADGFGIHADEFYEAAFEELEGIQHFFVAEGEDGIQAFLWNVVSPNGTCFELWGAVNEAGKASRANYYMKWVAICAAKEAGAKLYDLNGLLNGGISNFKMLFVPEPTYWVETHDKPLSPLYGLMDKALEIRRRRNVEAAAQEDTSRE
jgi:peptidoglycan pentaglycine glycine transferase (the first glycine)